MSKALAGVARTRIKAINQQVERLEAKVKDLQQEKQELNQLVEAYSTTAPETAEQFSSEPAEELV